MVFVLGSELRIVTARRPVRAGDSIYGGCYLSVDIIEARHTVCSWRILIGLIEILSNRVRSSLLRRHR